MPNPDHVVAGIHSSDVLFSVIVACTCQTCRTPDMLCFIMSRAIHDVKATDLGLSKVRFKAEVDFDGRVVTRSYLEKQDIDQILNDIQQVKTPEELENFMLKHGENIIDTLGAEVDRLEKELKQRNPEVRHVDLEIL